MEFTVDYERQKVRKNLTENLKYELDECSVEDVINTLISYRDALQIKGFIDLLFSVDIVNGYYDDHHVEIYITGAELESDKEYERRIKAQEKTAETLRVRKEKQKAQTEATERKLYEKLKKKFEKTGQA